LAGYLVQANAGLALALLLQFAKRGGVFLTLAAQAAFLDAEIVELALVGEKDLGFDEVLARRRIFICEELGKFQAAHCVDAHFERRDAEQTPFGVRQGLDEIAFVIAYRRARLHEFRYMGFVEDGVFRGKQDGAAGEPGFDGVNG